MSITKELKQFKSHKEIMWKHTHGGYTGLKSAVNEQSPFSFWLLFLEPPMQPQSQRWQ